MASITVNETTRGWFEKDVSLRAQLAVSGARQALVSHWHKEQRADLRDLLVEITHDERIMAAAACTADLTLLTRTPDYPEQFGCEELGKHVRPAAGEPAAAGAPGRVSCRCPAATFTSAPFPCSTEISRSDSSSSCTI